MSVTASKPGTGWRIPDPEEEKEIAADVSEDSEQSEPADAAVNAAADGDWAKVRLLLESGACDADEADEQGETAVAWAVRWGASTSACRETLLYTPRGGGALNGVRRWDGRRAGAGGMAGAGGESGH